MPGAKATNEPEINRLIGRRLRQLRLAKRWSLKAVAEKVGVTYQQVQKYESGANILSPATLVTVARLFDVHVGYFFKEPVGLEKYSAPGAAGLTHLIDRLQITERERPEGLAAIQDIVRVLCNEIQGVRPVPRPHRRTKAARGGNTVGAKRPSRST